MIVAPSQYEIARLPAISTWHPIPFSGSAGDEPPPPGSPVSPGQEASGTELKPLRILIIEDNRDYADGLQLLFELMGHQATVAYTGNEGVEAARRNPPDLIISDIGLPGMDGFDVARALRADAATAAVFLVAVTGYSSINDRAHALKCGFNAYLVKPVEAADILRLVPREPKSGGGGQSVA